MSETVDIPISAGKRIAELYGYDQVVIVARKVGVGEHVTTYGVDKANCDVAARMGNFFKYKLMGWPHPDLCDQALRAIELEREIAELRAQLKAAHGYGNDKGAPPWMK